MNLFARPLRSRPFWTLAALSVAAFASFVACTDDSSNGAPPTADAAVTLDATSGNDASTADASGSDVVTSDVTTTDAGTDAVADAAVDAADASDAAIVLPLDSGTYAAGATWGPKLAIAAPNYSGGLWGGQTLTFDAKGGLTKIENVSWSLSTTSALPEYGADGIVAWGRWADGTSTMGSGMAMVAPNYIAGKDTAQTNQVKASYAAFASTAPTAIPNGDAGTTLVGASNVVTGTITVSGSTITFALDNITVGGHTYAISGTTGFYAGTGMLGGGTVTSSTSGCSVACAGNITNAGATQGWFFGSAGERAGINYAFTSSAGDVSGAVVFK